MPTKDDSKGDREFEASGEALLVIDYSKGSEEDVRLPAELSEFDEDPEYVSIEATPAAARGLVCSWIDLVTIEKFPDVKLVWVKRCWKIGWMTFCTKVPKLYHRTCTIKYRLQICHPDLRAILRHVTGCLKNALAQGVATLLFKGKISEALHAIKVHLYFCLQKKKVQSLEKLHLGIQKTKTCSSWKAV